MLITKSFSQQIQVRILLTASDVIHAWWVPEITGKKDAIPGYINELWVDIKKPGVYRGQCTELCGKDHGFMPIVVRAVPKQEYVKWVSLNQKNRVADKRIREVIMSANIDHIKEEHHQPSGLMRWITTTNHKDIGSLYLWFSLLMFFIGGFMALIIRAELFQPGLQLVVPGFFNQMTTMHALIMILELLCQLL